MRLVIPGNTPALKNGKTFAYNPRTHRTFVTSSKIVKAWMKHAIFELQQQFRGLRVTRYPVEITCVFYFDTLRPRDLDNAGASVMDALKHAGVIEDDNYKFVELLVLQYGGLDKVNPRAEIYLDD